MILMELLALLVLWRAVRSVPPPPRRELTQRQRYWYVGLAGLLMAPLPHYLLQVFQGQLWELVHYGVAGWSLLIVPFGLPLLLPWAAYRIYRRPAPLARRLWWYGGHLQLRPPLYLTYEEVRAGILRPIERLTYRPIKGRRLERGYRYYDG